MARPPVGIVMPVWREGNRAKERVAALRYGGFDGPMIVSTADGDDATENPTGVTIVSGPAGRGGQMNRGAPLLDVETILFLHADTVVDPAVVATLDDRLEQADAIAGAFTLALGGEGIGYRLIERGVAWRSRWLSLPYGDQAIFVKREVFERVGGYPDIPLMEEVGLLRRLRRVGKIVILPEKATTSVRRYEGKGIVRTTLANWRTFVLYRLGANPAKLAERYYR